MKGVGRQVTREPPGSLASRLARDREILEAVARALVAEPAIELLAHNPHLETLRELTVGDFIEAVRFAVAPPRGRHLTSLPSRKGGTDMRECLSERELGVVGLIAEGLSNKEISARLELSDKTVKNHISHILAKLKLTARTQVAIMALRAGIF
jgi:DNA-binding NarL/FixJ family response regulator